MTDAGQGMADAPPPAGADPRPRPQYGEYAPPGWTPPPLDLRQLPPPKPGTAVPPPTSSRVDATASWALLGLGFIATLITWSTCMDLRGGLTAALAQQGIEASMPAWVATAGTVLAVGHVVLYLVTVFGTVRLLRAGRPAAWLPLGAGILAAVAFWTVQSIALGPYVPAVTF